jgi:hypothetical protein
MQEDGHVQDICIPNSIATRSKNNSQYNDNGDDDDCYNISIIYKEDEDYHCINDMQLNVQCNEEDDNTEV